MSLRNGSSKQPATGVAVWSTAAVRQDEAVDYWREVVCDIYVRLSTTPHSKQTFSGEVIHGRYPDFDLSVIRASGERVSRSRSLIARSREDEEYLYGTFQAVGRGVLEQAGHTAVLTPGSMVFYETSQPFSLTFDGPWEQVIVHLPVEQAYAMAGLRRSDELLAVALDSEGAAGAANAFFGSLAARQTTDPHGAALLARHATGLITSLLGLAAMRHTPTDLPDFVRREQVMSFLRTHMGDPRLDVDAIAHGCLLSRRTVYRLFEGSEHSVMGRLRQLRVETAMLMLRNQPDRPVSAVGQACGFATDAQFYRAFRQLTAMTPATYRSSPRPR
ncbi:helix-turn-helix domain-containing protein [Mycobacterium sp. Aquia_216]|uniref:AraC-like ligand-binding domain-containing protein n=1 Tax=Mycobacterium sp. Aquia_216 TaxID=2991729 RepID=UPI00227B1ACF|nr:helix-turn-helix domain-containing protein [Mycobacterium sp. Aquia_216]WAJ43698.1 helix-turn-helix domain-containing protein [Mycobacterium sp. Aquia_216]